MPSDPSFVNHAVDLLSLLGPVRARAMFGGHGLYLEDVMIALLDDGELFLKTDGETRDEFLRAGCRRWVYANEKVRMEETSYFRPPDDAHEDREAMLPWARLALAAALRSRATKRAKATAAPPARRAPRAPAAAPAARTAGRMARAKGATRRKRPGRA